MNSKKEIIDQITKKLQHKYGFDSKSYFQIQQIVKSNLFAKPKIQAEVRRHL